MCSTDIVAGYERLRNDVLDAAQPQAAAPGRALFQRQGMAAWMRAWVGCTTKEPVVEPELAPVSLPPLSQGLRAQVTMILTGMLLGQYRECMT